MFDIKAKIIVYYKDVIQWKYTIQLPLHKTQGYPPAVGGNGLTLYHFLTVEIFSESIKPFHLR